MKIAVSSAEKNSSGNVSEVFGRCPYFIIFEIEDRKIKEIEAIENNNTDQMSQAGVSTAQLVAEKKIDVVIAGNIGPRAMDVLNQFNIAVYSGGGEIKEILQKFLDNKLEKVN